MESRKWTSSAVKGTSCLDCPVRSEGLSAVGRCCAQQSGLYSDGFDPVDFEIETFEFDEAATSTLGILHPMEHSERLWEAGRAVIPGGTQTLGKGPIGFIDGVAPKYLSHGKGARVWDVDGNEFLDCWLAKLLETRLDSSLELVVPELLKLDFLTN